MGGLPGVVGGLGVGLGGGVVALWFVDGVDAAGLGAGAAEVVGGVGGDEGLDVGGGVGEGLEGSGELACHEAGGPDDVVVRGDEEDAGSGMLEGDAGGGELGGGGGDEAVAVDEGGGGFAGEDVCIVEEGDVGDVFAGDGPGGAELAGGEGAAEAGPDDAGRDAGYDAVDPGVMGGGYEGELGAFGDSPEGYVGGVCAGLCGEPGAGVGDGFYGEFD